MTRTCLQNGEVDTDTDKDLFTERRGGHGHQQGLVTERRDGHWHSQGLVTEWRCGHGHQQGLVYRTARWTQTPTRTCLQNGEVDTDTNKDLFTERRGGHGRVPAGSGDSLQGQGLQGPTSRLQVLHRGPVQDHRCGRWDDLADRAFDLNIRIAIKSILYFRRETWCQRASNLLPWYLLQNSWYKHCATTSL